MKYRIGEVVRVRKDLEVGETYDDCFFTEEMKRYLGEEIIIQNFNSLANRYNAYFEKPNDIEEYWSDEMLEPIPVNINEKLKRIYIAMPFSYDPCEAKKLYKLTCQALAYRYGDRYLFVSTIPLFDYLCKTSELIETNVMGMAYTLIDGCEEIWQFGSSKGVLQEVGYAKSKGINVRVME